MTDHPTDTDIIAAHAPFDWNGGMYDCKCGWDEHPEDWDAYAAHVAEALTAARTIATQHTFQVLTKRHARMRSLLSDSGFAREMWDRLGIVEYPEVPDEVWPLPNVWLGVSTEDQKWADIRIPALLETPAAVRFISAEPLIGPITLSADAIGRYYGGDPREDERGLDWVIVGGESGRGARPMHPDWARSLRDQCTSAGVPFLFKQWGGRTPKANGRDLDGRTWDEYPDSEDPS